MVPPLNRHFWSLSWPSNPPLPFKKVEKNLYFHDTHKWTFLFTVIIRRKDPPVNWPTPSIWNIFVQITDFADFVYSRTDILASCPKKILNYWILNWTQIQSENVNSAFILWFFPTLSALVWLTCQPERERGRIFQNLWDFRFCTGLDAPISW